jgi:hypothetical protein
LGDVDGEPPGIAFQKNGFPDIQDVVNNAACESTGDFNAKFVSVVAKFNVYHGIVLLGQSFSLGSAYSNSEVIDEKFLGNSAEI